MHGKLRWPMRKNLFLEKKKSKKSHEKIKKYYTEKWLSFNKIVGF